MKTLTLSRFLSCPHGTFGTFSVGDFHFMVCEEEWKANRPGESCIPAGQYILKRTIYHKHGYETFEVTGVPNRSRILIHPGNTEEDTQGCILPGLKLGIVVVERDEETGRRNCKLAVLESRKAFQMFMDMMRGVDEAVLIVSWYDREPVSS